MRAAKNKNHALVSFTEEGSEVFVVEFGETLTVVDGFAHDEHSGQRQVMVVNDFGEVLELTTIDFLVRPCEVVACCDRCVGRVFLQEFSLYVIHNGGAEEDAHGALTLGEKVQLLFLWHGGSPFATGENDGLSTFGNRELASQFCGSSEER